MENSMIRYFKNLFQRKRTDIRNCFHPDIFPYVEKAFVGAGVHSKKTQYYKFKGDTELDMPAGRYNKATKFFIEANMRISAEDLLFYLGKIKDTYSKDKIDLSEIIKWVGIIEDRTKLIIDDETAIKLASAVYFDETEILDTYDYSYNMKKIEAWKQAGDYSFFFIKPMTDMLKLPKSWKESFRLMEEYNNLQEKEKRLHMNTNDQLER